MDHIGLLGLFLFLADKSLSLQSSAFQLNAPYYDSEDPSPVLPTEKSQVSQLVEFLSNNQETKGQELCKNKENFADILKLLKRLKQSDKDSNDSSELDKFNDDDLNDDENSLNGIDVLHPTYQNKRNGKMQAKIVIILELPAPVTSKCKKAFSKLIEFTRGTFKSMARNDVCSRRNPSPYDFIFEKQTRKPTYPDVFSNSEEESTTRSYPDKTMQDEERLGQDYDNDSRFNDFSTETERVPIRFDNIFDKLSENQELANNPTISALNNNRLLNVEAVPGYTGKNFRDKKAILDLQNFYYPILESKTKANKNIRDEILSILEKRNNKDVSPYDLRIKNKPNNQKNILSLLENHFENEENAQKFEPELSYDDIISALHDDGTKYNVKDITPKNRYSIDEFEIRNQKPVQNAQTDIFSMLQNNEDYDNSLSDNFQLSPVSGMESNFDILQPQDYPSGIIKNSKNPYMLNRLSPDYEVFSHAQTPKSLNLINEMYPKKYSLSKLEQAKLLSDKLKYKKKYFLSPSDEPNGNFKYNQYPNYYHDYVPQLVQNDYNGLGYESNSNLFNDEYQFYPLNTKNKYGTSLNGRPETYANNILPLQKKFNTLEAFSQQTEAPNWTPYQVNNAQTNYHLFDNVAADNEVYQPAAFHKQDKTNPYKRIATPNQDGEIELTYLLKNPKPVLQMPIYYVKYRIPYQNYILNLRKQEKFKMSPKEFNKELIGSSLPIDYSPDLRMYPTNELKNLVASNGNLVSAAVKERNSTKRIINLKDVNDLRTLRAELTDSEIDLPNKSFGASDDKKRNPSAKDVISNLLETHNGYPGLNVISINKENFSNTTGKYPEKHESDTTQNSNILENINKKQPENSTSR